jgi:phage-related protein
MLQAILAQHTSEVMIELLEINHEALATPLRFCNDAVAVVSNGNRYEPWPFQVKLPTDDPEQEPRASITISNVVGARSAAIEADDDAVGGHADES